MTKSLLPIAVQILVTMFCKGATKVAIFHEYGMLLVLKERLKKVSFKRGFLYRRLCCYLSVCKVRLIRLQLFLYQIIYHH